MKVSDTGLLRSAVRNVRRLVSAEYRGPRWVAVRDLLAVGSTSAVELCLRFEVDPHETIGPDLLDALQQLGVEEEEARAIAERMGWDLAGLDEERASAEAAAAESESRAAAEAEAMAAALDDGSECCERSCSACSGTGTDYYGSDEYWQSLPCPHYEGSGVEIKRRELPPPEEEQ